MKKDDIIDQKLFETCKLSEFYLKLIVNSRFEDEESPLQLVHAFKQKLHEIVQRYDRLLDTSKQREQLKLSFDTINKTILPSHTPHTPTTNSNHHYSSTLSINRIPHSSSYTRLNKLTSTPR
jgi:hypothetical protein